ncbi:MAG: thrombospondin type 3 repeat-containing protein [Phycisphaerae bacterium]|nr:thrombospondin type 3 repeat-containing protein [Phycisphaerae bacterium]
MNATAGWTMRVLDCARRASARILIASAVLAFTTAAHAATFTVANVNDAGAGSLRQAILDANAAAGADVIEFQAGVSGTIALASDLPTITSELSINGPGPRIVSISGGNARRILNAGASLTLFGLRLANGFSDRGGGVQFSGSDNLLTVRDCHFDQCLVTNEGGAICILSGSVDVERVTFTTDQAAGSGGCIWYGQGGGTPTARIVNCTFVNNFASQAGGAIRQFSTTDYTAEVTNCTFVVNNAGNSGGAIAVAGGTMTLKNSLFTANAAGGNPGGHVGTVAGTTTSLGHNLFGHLDGANFAPDPTDKFGTVPAQLNTGILIAFPFNNGGLTDTLPPVNNSSILIDGGGTTGAPVTDQRGFPRVGCAPDVGAFEVQTLVDVDGDGVPNCLDLCPNTPSCAVVNETGCPIDSDADSVFDGCDVCPGTFAGDTVDADGCSTADEDGDGVLNDVDACRGTPPCAIASVDANGCPADADGDGLFDGCDQCPGTDDLTDTDADGIPDCLDACPAVGDSDGDGVQDCQDGCPADPLKLDPGACGCGVADVDSDGDGILDCDDACPATPACAAVTPTGCPIDSDADSVFDGCDVCPGTFAGDTVDADGCSTTDEDGDGVLNDADACRGTPPCAIASVDATGCPADADGDGLFDGCDQCPGTDDLTDTDADGIPDCLDACPAVGDSDGDGVQDCQDGCATDPLKLDPGACGCGNADTDTDGDGVADCLDGCPNDPAKLDPGACGCGNADADTDGDGVADCLDGCPNDPAKLDPGACGCGNADTDTDGDGVADCLDGCPNDPAKLDPGACGCGQSDQDTNANGIPDCIDPAEPAPQPNPNQPGLQLFIPLSPLLPGGVACGIGLALPTLAMFAGLLMVGLGCRCRRR